MKELMRIEGLKMYFGGLKAIDGFDLSIYEGETLGIIGPNGAGKTTLFNAICGVYTPTAGKVILPRHRPVPGGQTGDPVLPGRVGGQRATDGSASCAGRLAVP